MKKLFLFLLTLLILTSCSSEKKEERSVEINGGVYYGGVFKVNETDNFKSLFPLSVGDVCSYHIANQCYEGLVKFDQATLDVIPAISDRWSSNENHTIWTFHIRENVVFHNDSCFDNEKSRIVTAQDIKYCFDKLCQADPLNSFFEITFKDRVVGANEAFEKSKKTGKAADVVGVKVVNDTTITVELIHPNVEFTNILATAGCFIYPKEALDKYGEKLRTHCVGTGPYYTKTVKEGQIVVLQKNTQYWKKDQFGNQLPYLDAIKVSFINEKKSELIAFKKGDLDMIYRVPLELYKNLMGDYQHAHAKAGDFDIQTTPALSTDFYSMLFTHPIFSKKEVRLAFNHAIDKKKIVDFTLQGQGNVAKYGLIPPLDLFKKNGLNFEKLKGNEFDVEKAREYMKKAGYPLGKGFPSITLTINSAASRNQNIAEVIQKMLLENIGVSVLINSVPFPEQIQQRISGKAYFTRGSWAADYPDPASFLDLFYGKNVPAENENSYINSSRFKNESFDLKYEAALKENDKKKRYQLFMECDQILIDEGAMLTIFYNENDRLIQKYVRNFPINALEYRDFTEVYFVPKNNSTKKQ